MELASLLFAFCIFFVAVPALVAAAPAEGPWPFRCAAGFVRVSLFFRIAVMFLGLAGANFAGILVALWVTWSLGLIVWSQGQSPFDLGRRCQHAFLRVLQTLEQEPGAASWPRLPRISRFAALLAALTAVTLLHRAWFPLHNLRFASMETYSRALDLQMFMQRDSPMASGAAFLLAPLGVFSGLYGDSVIRFSGPLFATLLVLAAALCSFRWFQSPTAALVAAALVAVWPAVAGRPYPGEISSAEIAAVYWVLAAVFAGRSRWLTLYATSMALLVSWKPSPVLLPVAVSIALGYLLVRFLRVPVPRFHWVPAGVAAGVAIVVLLVDCRSDQPDGPFEYESAARACRSIASRFPRNEWLIISPVHELAFTYGRGWHFELLDFVSSHSMSQLEPKAFSLPYDVPDVFVFVEKHPLRLPGATPDSTGFAAFDLTQTMDRAVLAYNTGPGRASIEFKAAALLSAYSANHSDLTVFHEDDRLVVFHLKGRRRQG